MFTAGWARRRTRERGWSRPVKVASLGATAASRVPQLAQPSLLCCSLKVPQRCHDRNAIRPREIARTDRRSCSRSRAKRRGRAKPTFQRADWSCPQQRFFVFFRRALRIGTSICVVQRGPRNNSYSLLHFHLVNGGAAHARDNWRCSSWGGDE